MAARPCVEGPFEVEDDAVAGDGAFGQYGWHQQEDAKLALDELNALVVRELKKEGSIRLGGLGIFRKRKLAARVGRNPATGEQIKIPARTALHSRQSAERIDFGSVRRSREEETSR